MYLNEILVRYCSYYDIDWYKYDTLNQAALSSYAMPQLPYGGNLHEPRFLDFISVTINWYTSPKSDDWTYPYFNHREGGITCFGDTNGIKTYCIP